MPKINREDYKRTEVLRVAPVGTVNVDLPESEETEVKKDIEWLKSAIQQNLDFYNDNDEEWQMAKVRAYAKSLDLINQLDEPEVLSQEWISENVEYAYFDMLDGSGRLSSATAIIKPKKLQNLLVPEQELPVIPKFVADWMKENHGYNIYGALSAVDKERHSQVHDWVFVKGGINDFTRAWLDGYTVEEEQKYVVELPNPNNQLGRHKNVFLNKKDGEVFIDSASLFVNDITKYGQFALTEEEIKKDFEWAWAFAKPVEELEE